MTPSTRASVMSGCALGQRAAGCEEVGRSAADSGWLLIEAPSLRRFRLQLQLGRIDEANEDVFIPDQYTRFLEEQRTYFLMSEEYADTWAAWQAENPDWDEARFRRCVAGDVLFWTQTLYVEPADYLEATGDPPRRG